MMIVLMTSIWYLAPSLETVRTVRLKVEWIQMKKVVLCFVVSTTKIAVHMNIPSQKIFAI